MGTQGDGSVVLTKKVACVIQTFMDDNGGWSTQAGIGTVANDAAAVSQLLGAINPYEVTVEFYTTR